MRVVNCFYKGSDYNRFQNIEEIHRLKFEKVSSINDQYDLK